MYNFASDYLEGAHPQVMEALNKTNFIQTVGYGEDQYCQKAKDKIKAILENENVDIHFLVGGTQTNMIMISSALKDYQAVIAVDSGHINVHETGAVEFTGHKILTKPHQDGKMIPEMIDEIMREHPDEHMVQPKMVYISQTTEFIDGARLGSALVLKDAPTLQEMALYSDVFYIGGTKMGALFGECLVIINDELKTDFRYHIKQKGAMLAKGRLLGVQFNALFENDLYLEIGKHENECADILRKGFKDKGYKMYIESPSNQIFPIVDQQTLEKINKNYITTYMFKIDDQHICIRLVTSWATSKEICEQFIEEL